MCGAPVICKQSDAKKYNHGSHVSDMCKLRSRLCTEIGNKTEKKNRMIYLSPISVYNKVILNSEKCVHDMVWRAKNVKQRKIWDL